MICNLFVLLFVFISFVVVIRAEVVSVVVDGDNGDDQTCSIGFFPCKTIQKGFDILSTASNAEMTVDLAMLNITNGTYYEINLTWSANYPLKIIAVHPLGVRISGVWQEAALGTANWTLCGNLTQDPLMWCANATTSPLSIVAEYNSQVLYQWNSVNDLRSPSVQIEDLTVLKPTYGFVHDKVSGFVTLILPDGENPNNKSIRFGIWIWGYCIILCFTSYLEIEGVIFEGAGQCVWSHAVTVTNSLFVNCMVGVESKNSIVGLSEYYIGNLQPFLENIYQLNPTIQLLPEHFVLTYYNNSVYSIFVRAPENSVCTGCNVYLNYIHDAQRGVEITYFVNSFIHDNVFEFIGMWSFDITPCGFSDTGNNSIYNNLVLNTGSIFLVAYDRPSTYNDLPNYFYRNVIYHAKSSFDPLFDSFNFVNSKATLYFYHNFLWGCNSCDYIFYAIGSANITMYNNIIIYRGNCSSLFISTISANNIVLGYSPFFADHNIFLQWQGNETDTNFRNLGFLESWPIAWNYSTSSPQVNAGVILLLPDVLNITDGKPDIGPWEYPDVPKTYWPRKTSPFMWSSFPSSSPSSAPSFQPSSLSFSPLIQPSPPSFSPSSPSPSNLPTPNTICFGQIGGSCYLVDVPSIIESGNWIWTGNLLSQSLTVSANTTFVIEGNLTVPGKVIFDGVTSNITVGGCVNITSGNLELKNVNNIQLDKNYILITSKSKCTIGFDSTKFYVVTPACIESSTWYDKSSIGIVFKANCAPSFSIAGLDMDASIGIVVAIVFVVLIICVVVVIFVKPINKRLLPFRKKNKKMVLKKVAQ